MRVKEENTMGKLKWLCQNYKVEFGDYAHQSFEINVLDSGNYGLVCDYSGSDFESVIDEAYTFCLNNKEIYQKK
jgi:hypothetical protein